MTIELIYERNTKWPPLAWLAFCDCKKSSIHIKLGAQVEKYGNWFGEVAWAGEYVEGDFDRTDIVAGSGARVREEGVVFVSSGSTLDRLHVARVSEGVWISNSLPCVMNAAKLDLDFTYSKYYEDFYSIVEGVSNYTRPFRTMQGDVELIYFDNLLWDGESLSIVKKENRCRELNCFHDYERFMCDTMNSFSDNLLSDERKFPYRMLGTISTGYDSTAISAIASKNGCDDAVCFDLAYGGDDDSGDKIAKKLGLHPKVVSGDAWRLNSIPEIPFIASNAMGEEVRFKGAETHLARSVLLTGYHGDKVWSKHVSDVSPNLVRGDPSGLSLTEYRLWVGFLHAPIAFWGAQQIREFSQISVSKEMEPWDVPGDYSRPICRRLAEERGVPRELFGNKKKMASVIRHNDKKMLSIESEKEFYKWLGMYRYKWLLDFKLPPMGSYFLDQKIFDFKNRLMPIIRQLPIFWRLDKFLIRPTKTRRAVFIWAFYKAMNRYN